MSDHTHFEGCTTDFEGWSVGDIRIAISDALAQRLIDADLYGTPAENLDRDEDAHCILAALTKAGFAVVPVPEGIKVDHGSRLAPVPGTSYRRRHYRILGPR